MGMAMMIETEFNYENACLSLEKDIIELKKLQLALLHEVYRVKLLHSK